MKAMAEIESPQHIYIYFRFFWLIQAKYVLEPGEAYASGPF